MVSSFVILDYISVCSDHCIWEVLLRKILGLNDFNLQQRKILLPSSSYLNLPAQHCLIHAQRLRLSWITSVIQTWAASQWEDWFISTSLFSWEQSSMGSSLRQRYLLNPYLAWAQALYFGPFALQDYQNCCSVLWLLLQSVKCLPSKSSMKVRACFCRFLPFIDFNLISSVQSLSRVRLF